MTDQTVAAQTLRIVCGISATSSILFLLLSVACGIAAGCIQRTATEVVELHTRETIVPADQTDPLRTPAAILPTLAVPLPDPPKATPAKPPADTAEPSTDAAKSGRWKPRRFDVPPDPDNEGWTLPFCLVEPCEDAPIEPVAAPPPPTPTGNDAAAWNEAIAAAAEPFAEADPSAEIAFVADPVPPTTDDTADDTADDELEPFGEGVDDDPDSENGFQLIKIGDDASSDQPHAEPLNYSEPIPRPPLPHAAEAAAGGTGLAAIAAIYFRDQIAELTRRGRSRMAETVRSRLARWRRKDEDAVA